jgi:hypothetical protein
MARPKRNSAILETARQRLAGLKSITPTPDFGSTLSLGGYEQEINAYSRGCAAAPATTPGCRGRPRWGRRSAPPIFTAPKIRQGGLSPLLLTQDFMGKPVTLWARSTF